MSRIGGRIAGVLIVFMAASLPRVAGQTPPSAAKILEKRARDLQARINANKQRSRPQAPANDGFTGVELLGIRSGEVSGGFTTPAAGQNPQLVFDANSAMVETYAHYRTVAAGVSAQLRAEEIDIQLQELSRKRMAATSDAARTSFEEQIDHLRKEQQQCVSDASEGRSLDSQQFGEWLSQQRQRHGQ